MSIEALQTLSLVAYIIAAGFFLLAVVLFFVFDVKKLYFDISGRTAKKAIEAIREYNENSGNKVFKSSDVNAKRGKITNKITPSGNLTPSTGELPNGIATEKINAYSTAETTLLTAELPAVAGETTVLCFEDSLNSVPTQTFTIDVEIKYLGSTELVELQVI